MSTDETLSSTRILVFHGGLIVLCFFGVLMGWSFMAPLASGTVAVGVFSPQGFRRTLSHEQGGTISSVYAVEGEVVEVGQPLVQFESMRHRSALSVVAARKVRFEAMLQRLMSELDGQGTYIPSEELLSFAQQTGNARILEAEQALFEDRQMLQHNQDALVGVAEARYAMELLSAKEQERGLRTQLSLLKEESEAISLLLEQGYARRPALLAILRTTERVHIQISEVRARQSSLVSLNSEVQLSRTQAKVERREQIDAEISQVQISLSETLEQYSRRLATLEQLTLRAPVAGRVMNMQAQEAGVVFSAGQEILDLVPTDEEYLVDAHIAASEMKEVSIGAVAKVRLLTESRRASIGYDGNVVHVAGDVEQDKHGRSVFLVRVRLPQQTFDDLSRLAPELAGLPAEVTILTGSTRLIDYLLSPALDAFRRGLREQ